MNFGSKITGHSLITITADTYAHVLPKLARIVPRTRRVTREFTEHDNKSHGTAATNPTEVFADLPSQLHCFQRLTPSSRVARRKPRLKFIVPELV